MESVKFNEPRTLEICDADELSIVQIGKNLYLGELVDGNDSLENAVKLGTKDVSDELGNRDFIDYFSTMLDGRLVDMTLANVVGLVTRDLNDLEEHAYSNVVFLLRQAADTTSMQNVKAEFLSLGK